MVNGIGGGGGMAREAIAAALRAQQQTAGGIAPGGNGQQGLGATGGLGLTDGASGVSGAQGPNFADKLSKGLAEVNQQVNAADKLPEQMLNGDVNDFHDVAIQLKQSDLSFRFALQVRNKLIDSYREVMRMSV